MFSVSCEATHAWGKIMGGDVGPQTRPGLRVVKSVIDRHCHIPTHRELMTPVDNALFVVSVSTFESATMNHDHGWSLGLV